MCRREASMKFTSKSQLMASLRAVASRTPGSLQARWTGLQATHRRSCGQGVLAVIFRIRVAERANSDATPLFAPVIDHLLRLGYLRGVARRKLYHVVNAETTIRERVFSIS